MVSLFLCIIPILFFMFAFPPELLLIGSIVGICCFIQCTVGFAFSMFAIPFLLMANVPLPEAVTISIVASALNRVFFLYKMHQHVKWKLLFPMITIAILSLPIGLWLLDLVSKQSHTVVQQYVGGFILCSIVIQYSFRFSPQESVPKVWSYVSAFFSGVLNGLANVGGPPIILWIYAHKWTNGTMRAMTLAFSLPLIPFQILLLYLNFGNPILKASYQSLFMLPWVLIGSVFGLWVGNRLSINYLRNIVFSLLICVGFFYVLKPYVL